MAFLNDRPCLRRELLIGAFALFVGLGLMPVAIYLAGRLTLGHYGPDAGFGAFLGDFYGGLFHGSAAVWAIVIGPYVLLGLLRAILLVNRRAKT